MALSDVIRLGTDSSGRGIYVTRFMGEWWDELVEACQKFRQPFTPVIVQSAWMIKNGGGAKDSQGYHDKGGCLDIRTRNLTTEQQQFLVRECRRRAAGAWLRGPKQGMEVHLHLILGCDRGEIAPLAAAQWKEYVGGGDGLVGSKADYHWRPSPLVTSWSIPPKPTPNITAALSAKTREDRKRALRRVINHGSAPARKAATAWLNSILAIEAAQKSARASRTALKDQERV